MRSTKHLLQQHREQQKKKTEQTTQRVIYWTILIILGIASLVFSFILVPFVLFVDPLLTYGMTMVVGLVFGFVYAFLVIDLEHLEKKHHVFLSIYIPLIATMNIFLLLTLTKHLAAALGGEITTSPVITSFFLLFSLSLPYLFFGLKYVLQEERKKHW